MTIYTNFLVFPDGDTMETGSRPVMNSIVDMNGQPLRFPIRTTRIIAYRVFRISTDIKLGEENKLFHLELMSVPELEQMNH